MWDHGFPSILSWFLEIWKRHWRLLFLKLQPPQPRLSKQRVCEKSCYFCRMLKKIEKGNKSIMDIDNWYGHGQNDGKKTYGYVKVRLRIIKIFIFFITFLLWSSTMHYVICKTLSDIDGQMENESWINVLLLHRGKKKFWCYSWQLWPQLSPLDISKSIFKILVPIM